jgi:hypothetical protein
LGGCEYPFGLIAHPSSRMCIARLGQLLGAVPSLEEPVLGCLQVRGSADWRPRDVDDHVPQPDAGRALRGEPDPADALAVLDHRVVVLSDRAERPSIFPGGDGNGKT